MEQTAYRAIRQFIALAEKETEKAGKADADRRDGIAGCLAECKTLQGRTEQLKTAKLRLYEKYAGGEIGREEYRKAKAETDAKLAETAEKLTETESRMAQLEAEREHSDDGLTEACRTFRQSERLTYEMAHAFIKAIYVYPDDRVEIEWKFKDFLME